MKVIPKSHSKEQKRRANRKKLIQRHGKEKYQALVDIGLIDRFDY